MRARIAFGVLAVALMFALAGCGAASSPTPSATDNGETTATPSQYSAAQSSAGLGLGAELQRTADWKLGGKVWVFSVTGKADLAGAEPAIAIVAVNADGSRKVIQTVSAGATTGVGSAQGTFVVPIPAGTTTLLVTTTLRSKDATGEPPGLTIPLADVTAVKSLTLVDGQQ